MVNIVKPSSLQMFRTRYTILVLQISISESKTKRHRTVIFEVVYNQ